MVLDQHWSRCDNWLSIVILMVWIFVNFFSYMVHVASIFHGEWNLDYIYKLTKWIKIFYENIMSTSIIDLIKWYVKHEVDIKNIAINLVHCIAFDSSNSFHPNTSPLQRMFYTHPCCDQSFGALQANDYTFDNVIHSIITKLLLVVLMEVQKQVS